MILLLETVHHDAHHLLEAVDDVVVSETPVLHLEDAPPDVRAIITRGRGRIGADAFERIPALQVVARCGVGLDNIDTEAAARAGVPVVHAPGSTTHAVVEHALMLMLALARRVIDLDDAVKDGDWSIREGYEGIEMRGKRLGVVGFGAIGSRIAELGKALSMDVVCTTRRTNDVGALQLSLDELLRTSDVVQLCVPMTDDTRRFIGAEQLAAMKPGALLINTARGPLVDHDALVEALEHGHLGGYAADVWDPEPPAVDDKALASGRVVITPHIAALTDVTYREICVRTVEAAVAILTGGVPDAQCVFGGAAASSNES